MNIVAGLCGKQWVAPMQYDSSTDSVLFEFWFEHCLLKEVGRGKYIVLDNARFHRKAKLTQLAEHLKCKVLFLPPYSPDLNPIEKKWAWLKQLLREILPNCRVAPKNLCKGSIARQDQVDRQGRIYPCPVSLP